MKNFSILLFFFYIFILHNELDAQWIQTNGPYGGSVWSFTVNGSNIFAGGNGGGVFLSTNNGTSWSSINSGLTNTYIYSLTVSGVNLFAGTSDGVFLSTNNGSSWTQVNSGLTSLSIYSLAVIGTNVFAGTGSGGVFLSTNNGTNWTQVNSGLTSSQIRALAVIGTNLFAGTYGGGIFLSTNNGTNWAAVNGTLTSNDKYIYSFAVDGSDLYAGSYTGVFLSTNNGTNWTSRSSGLPANLYVYGLGISSTNMFAATGEGIYFSTNNGTNWTPVNLGIVPLSLCIAVSGTNILAGTLGDGIFRTTNNGTNWEPANIGLRNSLIVSTSVINSTLYATSSYDGILASTDNGISWSSMNSGITSPYVNDIFEFETNLFAATVGGGIFRSTNNGANWNPVNSGVTNLDVYKIASSGSNLFAGTYGGGVFLSTNSGTNWTSVNSGITNLGVTALLCNGTDIYAGTWNGGVFRSTNNGTNWIAVNTGLNTTASKQIASLIASGPNILAGTTAGVYYTSNNGGNWTLSSSGITNTWISALAISGTNVFAGTKEASVYLSKNNGLSWIKVSEGFTTSSDVYGLAASSTDLFAGTFGSGVWKRPLLEIIGGPGLALNPNPSDSAVNIGVVNLLLSWTNPAGAASNRVMFGTNPSSLTEIHSGSLVTNVNAPSPLEYNTVYFWRVDEINSSGTSIGDIWSFTTMDNPSAVTLLFDDFESGTGNWVISNNGGTCVWQIFFPPYPSTYGPYTLPPTSSGGVFSADATECHAAVLSTATTVNQLNADDYLHVELEFDNDWRHYNSGDQAHVEVSTDSVNWISVWSKIGVSHRNTHEIINISTYVAESSFWLRFRSVQPGWDYWWVIDNVKIKVWDIIPVELTSFTASSQENKVVLKWTTASEVNNQGFEIERKVISHQSPVTSPWEKIGYVAGYGTTTEPKDYSFNDKNAAAGNYAYRLKQVNFDGTFEYSHEVEVENLTPQVYALYQNYPNPFNPSTKIKYQIPVITNVEISIYNLLGEKVADLVRETKQPGYYEVEMNASNLSSGIYYYQMKAGSFNSVQKMILMR